MKVSGCQLPVSMEIAENVRLIKQAIDRAADDASDILLTPECALSGYLWRAETALDHRLKKLQPALDAVVDHAVNRGVDLALGTAVYEDHSFEYQADKKWYNQLRFYVGGQLIHCHNKIMLTVDEPYSPGTDLKSFDYKGIKTAGLICNDLWVCGFQRPGDAGLLARQLRDQGVRLCFLAANTPKMPSDPDYFYAWSDVHLQTYSRQGLYSIAVADNCNLQNGVPYKGRAGTPCGVMDSAKGWVVKTPDSGLQYYSYEWS